MDKSPTIILSGDQVGARKVFLLSPSMSIILPNIITVTSEYIKGHMVSRNVFSKKGENGIVLVVGGSSIYHGAPLLASLAALRAGTDLVYTGVPQINYDNITILFSKCYCFTYAGGPSYGRFRKQVTR